MKIEDLKSAAQSLAQLENINSIIASGEAYINRGKNTATQFERMFICQHSDSSGPKIELDEDEKDKIKKLIHEIVIERKNALADTIESI